MPNMTGISLVLLFSTLPAHPVIYFLDNNRLSYFTSFSRRNTMAAKHIEIAQNLKESLKRRFTITEGFDATGLPTLLVGAGTAGSQSAFIRVKPIDSIGTDSLGLAQKSFGPHVIQVVLETSTVANVALMLESNKLPLMAEIAGRGTRVELYLSANTNAVDVTDIVTGNLKATWDGFSVEFGVMAAV